MTEVISLEAKFKSTGVSEVVNGFEQIGKAAKAANQQQKDALKDGRDYFASQRMQATAMKEMNREFENRRKAALTMFPAFEKAKTSVSQWATANAGLLSTVGAVAGVVYGAGKAAAASYMEFQNYAGSVRDLSAISGTGAEETSRFIQVLDDFEISAQDVTTATKAMTKQGLAPTVETLAALAKQYQNIQDPMERNAFVLKNLGKGGLNWVNALKQQPSALLEMGNAVDKNLVLTEEQIATSEEARLAIDALSDSWTGVKVAVGSSVGGLIVANKRTQDMREQFASLGLETGALTSRLSQGATPAFDRFRKQMEKGAATTAFYTAQTQKSVEVNGEVTETEDEKNARLQMALSGGMQLTQMQIAMRAKSLELNTALAEQTSVLENLRTAGYSETSTKIQDQIKTVDELKGAITKNNEAQSKSYQAFALSVLAAKDAGLEQQLAFAVASGQITQGAANQQMAQDQLAQAFIDGGITAETYASQIATLMQKVSSMDGRTAKMYIDIFIREHGAGANLAAITQEKLTETGGAQGQHGGVIGDAAGGPLNSNGWTLVGDRPGGAFVDGVSELVSPQGYVYDARTSKKILDSGMLGQVESRAFGGDLSGGYTSTPTVSIPYTPPKTKPQKSSRAGSDMSVSVQALEMQAGEMQNTTQMAVSSLAMQNQQMTQQILNSNQQVYDVLSDIASILKFENPNAVGAAVGYVVAKNS